MLLLLPSNALPDNLAEVPGIGAGLAKRLGELSEPALRSLLAQPC